MVTPTGNLNGIFIEELLSHVEFGHISYFSGRRIFRVPVSRDLLGVFERHNRVEDRLNLKPRWKDSRFFDQVHFGLADRAKESDRFVQGR